jgi:hypothetical protein
MIAHLGSDWVELEIMSPDSETLIILWPIGDMPMFQDVITLNSWEVLNASDGWRVYMEH